MSWDDTADNATCASTDLVCRAGRAGTGNDFTISTSGADGGSILGSTVADAPLNLNAGDAANPGAIRINQHLTDLGTGSNIMVQTFMDGLTISTASDIYDFVVGARHTNDSVILEDHGAGGAGAHKRIAFHDFRKTIQAAGIGGETGASVTNPDLMDSSAFRTEAEFVSNTGSVFNMLEYEAFKDGTRFVAGGGTLNHLDDYTSFHSYTDLGSGWTGGSQDEGISSFKAEMRNGGNILRWVGLRLVAELYGTGKEIVGIQSDTEWDTSHADSRFILHRGNAPSVHVGTVRIGDTATGYPVAVQDLEVEGNVKIDNDGATPGELRFDEPSGDHYTAFKAQAQAGDLTYTLPAAYPASNDYVLASSTGGTLSWNAPGGGADCTTGSALLCLAGRAGTANNPILSTDSHGILTGSDDAADKLRLRGNTDATKSSFNDALVTIEDQITSITTSSPMTVLEWPAAFTLDGGLSIVNVFNASEHRSWRPTAHMTALGGVRSFVSAPEIIAGKDFSDTSTDTMGAYWGLLNAPQIHPDTGFDAYLNNIVSLWDQTTYCRDINFDGTCDSGAEQVRVAQHSSVFLNVAVNSEATVDKFNGLFNQTALSSDGVITEMNLIEDVPTIGASATLTTRRLAYMRDRASTGTQGTVIGLDVDDQNGVGTLAAAVRSALDNDAGKWHLRLTGTAPSLFGGPIHGSESADGNLTIRASSNADQGVIDIGAAPVDTSETVLRWAATYDGFADTPLIFNVNPTVSNTGAVGTLLRGYNCTGTITTTASGGSISVPICVMANWTVASSVNRALPQNQTFNSSVTYSTVGHASTPEATPLTVEFKGSPVYVTTTNGNTSTITHATVFSSNGVALTPSSGATQVVTDLSHFTLTDAALNGAGTETLTRQNGLYIPQMDNGTSNLAVRIEEIAANAIGTVPTGSGVVTVTSGSPNRVTFVNEQNQPTYPAMATWTGVTSSLASDNTTRYFPINDRGTADTTEGTHDIVSGGALTIHYMTCSVSADPDNGGGGNGDARTFRVREDADGPGAGAAANTAVACTITETATQCTWCPTGATGCTANGTPEPIAAVAFVNLVSEAALTPEAAEATCSVWWTLDAF